MRRRRALLSIVPLLALALALSACGGSGRGLIPATSAGNLQTDLNDVAAAFNAGDCTRATEMVQRARGDFQSLPPSVNAQLRDRISSGIDDLDATLSSSCSSTTTTATSSTQTSTRSSSTSTTVSSSAAATTTTALTSAAPTTTAAAPTTTAAAPLPPAPDNNVGGVGAPGGGQ